MQKYSIITLSAKEMLARSHYRLRQASDTGNWELCFSYELPLTREDFAHPLPSTSRIITSVETVEDNAYLWQLRRAMNIEKNSPEDLDTEILRNTLLYIDFLEVFRENDMPALYKASFDENGRPVSSDGEIITFSEAELMSETLSDAVKLYFLLQNGFTISFRGEERTEEKHFVISDRSNSMVRRCMISCVDSSLAAVMNERLNMGMRFTDGTLQVFLSKYYAYRGLTFSTAKRMKSTTKDTVYPGQEIVLNSASVIVVSDRNYRIKSRARLPRKKLTGKALNNGSFDQSRRWTIAEEEIPLGDRYKSREGLRVNVYDGEGLISPFAARQLSSQLISDYRYRKESHSFQIRMPFTKGMLHEVDFHQFYEEEFSIPNDNLFIEDVFGIKRNLADAQIILTQSMFKCWKWLQDSVPSGEDPMEYYFRHFEKYDHSLYVIHTDANLRNSGMTPLSYQFLSTLKLSAEDIDTLLENDKKAALRETFRGINSETWYRAFLKNPAFLKTPRVDQRLRQMISARASSGATGQVRVAGETRFLSGDLLSFLYYLEGMIEQHMDEAIFTPEGQGDLILASKEKIQKLTLFPDRVYMAGQKVAPRYKWHYGILRSPHLSRPEQCALRSCEGEPAALYNKYFSQLGGVVMVSQNSPVPMALAGADFDGDEVKIIGDPIVVRAIIEGIYKKSGNMYNRDVPVIEIPSSGDASKVPVPDSIPLKTLVDTFASSIGIISNYAVEFSEKEYVDGDPQYKNRCEECTITAGLDIDAAKNGKRPAQKIKELGGLSSGKGSQNFFLKNKEALESLAHIVYPNISATDYTVRLKNSRKDFFFVKKKEVLPDRILSRLPAHYFTLYRELKAEFDRVRKELPEGSPLFRFQTEEGKPANSDDPYLQDRVNRLRKTYNAILREGQVRSRIRKSFETSDFKGRIYTLLQLRFDEMDTPIGDMTPEEMADSLYLFLYRHLHSVDACEDAIRRLNTEGWGYLPKEERREAFYRIIRDADSAEGFLSADAETADEESGDIEAPDEETGGKEKNAFEPLEEPVMNLITDFSGQGYMFLYYALMDIRICLAHMDPAGRMESALPSKKDYPELWDQYLQDIRGHRNATYCKNHLVESCRDRLSRILRHEPNYGYLEERPPLTVEEEETVLRCLAAYGERSLDDFLWDVLSPDTILSNIADPKEPSLKDAERNPGI